MNKRILFFVGLFFLSTMPFSGFVASGQRVKKDILQNSPRLKQFLSSYMAALTMGGCVGVATGSVVGSVQNKIVQYFTIESSLIRFFLTLATCTIGSEIRDSVIAGLQSNLDEYEIGYQKDPMVNSAMITSVLAYFHV